VSYLKLEVRSGGLVIRNESKNLQMRTVIDSDGIEGIELITPSSIKGMLSFLMGERRRIFEPLKIKGNKNKTSFSMDLFDERVNHNRALIHNDLLNKVFEKVKYEIIKQPFLTSFYERKDSHRYIKDFPTNPSISLSGKSWDDADPTIKLLKNSLMKGTGKNSLATCNKAIKDSQEEYKNKFKKIKSIDDLKINPESKEYLHQINNLVLNLPVLKKNNSKFRIKLSEIVESIKLIDFNNIEVIKKGKLLNPVYLKVIDAAVNEYNATEEDIKKESSSKFSVLTDPDQNRHWIDKEGSMLVKGAPGLLACTDFNLWIEDPPQEYINLVLNGPQMAYWAEGGVVTYRYTNEPIPPEGTKSIAIPIINLKTLAKYKIYPPKKE
jgi:hypothetical protein